MPSSVSATFHLLAGCFECTSVVLPRLPKKLKGKKSRRKQKIAIDDDKAVSCPTNTPNKKKKHRRLVSKSLDACLHKRPSHESAFSGHHTDSTASLCSATSISVVSSYASLAEDEFANDDESVEVIPPCFMPRSMHQGPNGILTESIEAAVSLQPAEPFFFMDDRNDLQSTKSYEDWGYFVDF